MAMIAMWIPGVAARMEQNTMNRGGMLVNGVPWSDVLGLCDSTPSASPTAGSVTYRCQANSTYTFHFPIPTPVILNNNRASFIRAMAFFKVPAGGALQRVQVFDGVFEALRVDGLSVTGDHQPTFANLADGVTRFAMLRRDVNFGVDLALTFRFNAEGNVTLYTAGIDFDV